eukprot:768228-Hanusia_phi.AAC.1
MLHRGKTPRIGSMRLAWDTLFLLTLIVPRRVQGTTCPLGTYTASGSSSNLFQSCSAGQCPVTVTSNSASAPNMFEGRTSNSVWRSTYVVNVYDEVLVDLQKESWIELFQIGNTDTTFGFKIYVGNNGENFYIDPLCVSDGLWTQNSLETHANPDYCRGKYVRVNMGLSNYGAVTIDVFRAYGCYLCPPGYTTLSTGSTSVLNCVLTPQNEGTDCPAGSFTSTGKSTFTNSFTSFANLLSQKQPWGVYHAESVNGISIPESYGSKSAATITGSASSGRASGNGAAVNVAYVSGGTSTSILFPSGSIPSTFTLCSITRWTTNSVSGSSKMILTSNGDFNKVSHGHDYWKTGHAYYNGFKTSTETRSIQVSGTEWLVMCGTNDGSVSTPNNIKIGALHQAYKIRNVGLSNGGSSGSGQLGINTYSSSSSDFSFSQVYIWDQGLDSSEMDTVMYALLTYLSFELDLRKLESVYTPSYFINYGCNSCPYGYYQGANASTSCTACPTGKITASLASTSSSDCFIGTQEATAQCPAGAFSASGNGLHSNAYSSLSDVLVQKPPWAIYHAEDWDGSTIVDSLGGKASVTVVGSGFSSGTEAGYGSIASVAYVKGGTTNKMFWPSGSIPSDFTICAMTRYTGGTFGRILNGNGANWFQGHWYSGGKGTVDANIRLGIAYYGNNFFTSQSSYFNNKKDWLMMCGARSGPKLAAMVSESGTGIQTLSSSTGGLGGFDLSINDDSSATSDFAFSQVYIWSRALNSYDMERVLSAMVSYHITGISLATVEGVNYYGCSPCAVGYYTSGRGSTGCTACSAGYYAGSVGTATCAPCPSGSYTGSTASTACTPCNPGYYSGSASTACTPCDPGYFASSSSTSTCTACPAGSYTGVSTSTACTPCPIGKYATSTGNSQCTACPGDYTNFVAGSSSLSDCKCPVGYYDDGTGRSKCNRYPKYPYHITTAYDVTTVFGTGVSGTGATQLSGVDSIVLSPSNERYAYTCDYNGNEFVKLDLIAKTKIYTCGLNGNTQGMVIMPDEQTAYTRGNGNGLISKYTLTASSCSYVTYAGTGSSSGWATGVEYARLSMPIGVLGQDMVLMNDQITFIFSDDTLNAIWKLNTVTEKGSILFSNAPSGCRLLGLTLSNDNSKLYFTCYNLYSVYMVHMSDLSTAIRIAGNGVSGTFSDGYGSSINFKNPLHLYMSPVSNQLFLSDTGNYIIVAIDLDNNFYCRNIVGVVGANAKLDNAVGTSAKVKQPRRMWIRRNGSIAYFTDSSDFTIRSFNLNYDCGVGFYDDGTGTGTCLPCAVGYYSSVSGSTSCTVCPGQYTTFGVGYSSCGCPRGYYDDGTGTNSCTRCPHMTVTTSASTAGLSDCVPYAPLVSYQFEDPADLGKDSSGNNNHATNYGATYGAGRRGDGAAKFSSAVSTQYLQLTTPPDFGAIQQSTGVTVSFWGYMSTASTSYARFFEFYAGCPDRNWAVWRQNAVDNVGFLASYTTSWSGTGAYANKWMIWVDNVLVCNGCVTQGMASIAAGSRFLNIASTCGGTDALDGYIDDMRFYDFTFIQFDVDQHYFPLYNPTGCLPIAYNPNPGSYHYPELVASKDFPGVTNLNSAVSTAVDSLDTAFRAMVDNDKYATIVRVCYDCGIEYWLTFYKRILPADPG